MVQALWRNGHWYKAVVIGLEIETSKIRVKFLEDEIVKLCLPHQVSLLVYACTVNYNYCLGSLDYASTPTLETYDIHGRFLITAKK